MNEPLVQTQVLPYLRGLNSLGMRVSILTFESQPNTAQRLEDIALQKKQLEEEGIRWQYLRYHKYPSVPATLFDIFLGSIYTLRFLRKHKPDILHARVHIPALMAAIAKRFYNGKTKLLFDIRGFFPEEYTDAGRWKKDGIVFRVAKRVEKWLIERSDGFVVLTKKARAILFPNADREGFDEAGRPVEVIPCCVDIDKFRASEELSRRSIREDLSIENRNVVVYVGSFGGWYLTEETADFLAEARVQDPSTFALILTQSDPKMIQDLLVGRGFTEEDFLIRKVKPDQIPKYLRSADFALSFILPCYSKQASSPTKNAEYLASGLPIVVNSGVGDTAEMTIEDETGVVIDNFDVTSYRRALSRMAELKEDPSIETRCRTSATERFDLQKVGVDSYWRLYQRLLTDAREK